MIWFKCTCTISSLREACKGIPTCKFHSINQVFSVKVKQINLGSKTPDQNFKVRIYVALGCGRQAGTLKFIERIEDNDS